MTLLQALVLDATSVFGVQSAGGSGGFLSYVLAIGTAPTQLASEGVSAQLPAEISLSG